MTYWCRIRDYDTHDTICKLESSDIRLLYYSAYMTSRDVIYNNANITAVSFKIYSDDRNYRRIYISGMGGNRKICYGKAHSLMLG